MEKEKIVEGRIEHPSIETKKKLVLNLPFGDHKTCYSINNVMAIDDEGKAYDMCTQITWK